LGVHITENTPRKKKKGEEALQRLLLRERKRLGRSPRGEIVRHTEHKSAPGVQKGDLHFDDSKTIPR